MPDLVAPGANSDLRGLIECSATNVGLPLGQARVVAAAHRIFLERGYAGATIPRIASEAGLAVETVYRAAPGKAGLLAAAVETALAGGAMLAEQGALRAGLSPHRAADLLVTVCGRASYDSLVTERGWTPEEYRGWVADTLVHTLLRS